MQPALHGAEQGPGIAVRGGRSVELLFLHLVVALFAAVDAVHELRPMRPKLASSGLWEVSTSGSSKALASFHSRCVGPSPQ